MHYRLLLGSKSPRRRELLAGLNFDFTPVDIETDECYPSYLSGRDIPLYLARAKARAYCDKLQDGDVLITSDTIVWCNNQVLGKPVDYADAVQMLQMLSGSTHEVFTGVCITRALIDERTGEIETEQTHAFVDATKVTFRTLEIAEIDYYIHHYAPYDKAGAYGIQEWIGYIGVEKIEGSFYNVMGFPIERVYLALKQIGF